MPKLPNMSKVFAAPDIALPHLKETLTLNLEEVEKILPNGLPKLSTRVRGVAVPRGLRIPKVETFLKGPSEAIAELQASLGLTPQGGGGGGGGGGGPITESKRGTIIEEVLEPARARGVGRGSL